MKTTSKYKPMSDVNVKRFISEDTEVVYVIKTGFQDKYIAVFEDAFEISIGKTVLGTKEEIESNFKIRL